MLAGAAIAGTEDPLKGLKENVILGKLVPAGTGHEANSDRIPLPEPREMNDFLPGVEAEAVPPAVIADAASETAKAK